MIYYKALNNFLLRIDQFGVPITLRIGNHGVYNTVLGSMVTILLVFILLRSLYGLSYDLVNKGNP